MTDLKDRPQHLVLLLPVVRRVLRVLHLVRELEQRVLELVEAVRWRLTRARGADWGHGFWFVFFLEDGGAEGYRWVQSGWVALPSVVRWKVWMGRLALLMSSCCMLFAFWGTKDRLSVRLAVIP